MEGHDIILLTETHQSPERGLPKVEGYQWESGEVHKTEHYTRVRRYYSYACQERDARVSPGSRIHVDLLTPI